MVAKATPPVRKRAARTNSRNDGSSPIYKEPGTDDSKARHLACWKKAGIDPIKNGYELVDNAGTWCMPCLLVYRRYAGFRNGRADAERDQQTADLLAEASKELFGLLRDVATHTAGGILNLDYDLEGVYGPRLKAYRTAMEGARRAALELPLTKGEHPKYRNAGPNGKDYLLNLGDCFKSDLTMSCQPRGGYLEYGRLACEAGFLAAASHAFQDQAKAMMDLILPYGADEDDAARREAALQKACRKLAARSLICFDHLGLNGSEPRLVRMDAKANLWSQRDSREKSAAPSPK